MRYLLLLALLIWVSTGAARAATPLRPYSGMGVLVPHPAPGTDQTALPLYAEPGVQRIAELEPGALPRLSGDLRQPLLAVHATKGEWLKVSFDEAGRAGWLEAPRSWVYRSWDEFLPGQWVRVLPGLKKVFYSLKGAPREASTDSGTVSRNQQVRIVQVADDWARLERPAGWIRWRDADGRLTVSP